MLGTDANEIVIPAAKPMRDKQAPVHPSRKWTDLEFEIDRSMIVIGPTRHRLFDLLERLKTSSDAVALSALELATMYFFRLRQQESPESRVPRMSEWMISPAAADRPALLENRIYLLRVAAEILSSFEGGDALDSDGGLSRRSAARHRRSRKRRLYPRSARARQTSV